MDVIFLLDVSGKVFYIFPLEAEKSTDGRSLF